MPLNPKPRAGKNSCRRRERLQLSLIRPCVTSAADRSWRCRKSQPQSPPVTPTQTMAGEALEQTDRRVVTATTCT